MNTYDMFADYNRLFLNARQDINQPVFPFLLQFVLAYTFVSFFVHRFHMILSNRHHLSNPSSVLSRKFWICKEINDENQLNWKTYDIHYYYNFEFELIHPHIDQPLFFHRFYYGIPLPFVSHQMIHKNGYNSTILSIRTMLISRLSVHKVF